MRYDANGLLLERRDFNGNKTQYAYETARGLETVRVEGMATAHYADYRTTGIALPQGVIKTSTQWHADLRRQTKVAAPGLITTYIYNGDADPYDNDQVATCAPPLSSGSTLPLLCRRVKQASSDRNGAQGLNAIPDSAYVARQYVYTYNVRGQLLTTTRLPDNTLLRSFDYYEANSTDATIGDLSSITNALGQRTTFTQYNASGYPLRMIDPNGVETVMSYDPRNRLLTQSIDGSTTTHRYDLNGNRISSEFPNGVIVTYRYDAAKRLIGLEDTAGGRIEYELDLEGNQRFERIYNAGDTLTYTREHSYDALSRLMQTRDANDNLEVNRYDANGNLTGITAPSGNIITQVFDTRNRLTRIIDTALQLQPATATMRKAI